MRWRARNYLVSHYRILMEKSSDFFMDKYQKNMIENHLAHRNEYSSLWKSTITQIKYNYMKENQIGDMREKFNFINQED